jgi:Protein of unknown function (DUF3500)
MKPARFALVAVMGTLLGVAFMRAADRAPAEMAGAANRLLGSLTSEQKAKATFPFEGEERMRWHYIPTGPSAPGFPRHGLTLGEMSTAQRDLARALLKTGMSARGFMTVTAIMDLEDVLRAIEEAEGRAAGRAPTFRRDPLGYFVSVFGTPAANGTWGWRVDGHHVSLHFTIVNGEIAVSTPTFFGTNPADVKDGPRKGLRILAEQEDLARALVMTLTDAERAKAIITRDAPGDILTTNRYPIDPLTPAGIAGAELTAPQREQLMRIVNVYTSAMTDEIAAKRMGRLRAAGAEKIAFAWAGELERGRKHYYRVQGPTFLIEYDNTQNDGNHVHSVWRDFNGDFGRDLLREHLTGATHR